MIRFVVALPAEARPLIAHYRLRQRPGGACPVYASDAIALVISGVGKRAAAEATACLQAVAGDGAGDVWLNVGIAGHRTRPLGEPVLAHRLRDESSARSWYPPLAFDVPCATENVLTVAKPQAHYLEGWALDMEATGFYETACRFTSAELVQVLKLISDNAANPPERVRAQMVARLIGERLGLIDALVAALRALAAELPRATLDEELLASLVRRWHFTVSERHRLRRLLARWHVLAPGRADWYADLERAAHADAVLRLIEQHLRTLPTRLARNPE